MEGSMDADGEDAILMLDGKSVVVQVVTVPADSAVWGALARQGALRDDGTMEDAVTMIRQALERKRGKAIGVILVLEATHFWGMIGPRLVKAYADLHGDPECEFSVAEAWVVGPTPRSSIRLRSSDTGSAA
jgi:hypothetical protein